MVEVVRERPAATFSDIKDGEFFLFCGNLYLKSSFYDEEEGDYNNAYCFEVDDNHYTFFEDEDDVIPVNVRITILSA